MLKCLTAPLSGRQILMAVTIILTAFLLMPHFACPNYTNTEKYMRETAAVAGIETIQRMQVQYRSQYGRYAAALSELGPPQNDDVGPAGADLIGKDLAGGEKQGYRFALAATADGYTIHADPITFGVSGNKSFYSDQTAVIRENYGPEPATASSRALN